MAGDRVLNPLSYEGLQTEIRRRGKLKVWFYIGLMILVTALLVLVGLFGKERSASSELPSFLILPIAAGVYLVSIYGILTTASPTPVRFTERGIVAATALIDSLLKREARIIEYSQISKAYWSEYKRSAKFKPGVVLWLKPPHKGLGMVWLDEGEDIASLVETISLLQSKGIKTVKVERELTFPNIMKVLLKSD